MFYKKDIDKLYKNVEHLYKQADEDRAYLIEEIRKLKVNYKFNEKYKKEINDLKLQYEADAIDEEDYHRAFDEILCSLLRELGYRDIVFEFKEAKEHFWYS